MPSIYSSARRRVSANFDNTSKIRAFGSVRIFGDDAKGLSFGTGRRWSLSRSPLRQTVPPLMLRVPTSNNDEGTRNRSTDVCFRSQVLVAAA